MKNPFSKRVPLRDTPTNYPAGTFIKTESGYFYIVGPGKRYRLLSSRVLDSWSPQRVVGVKESAVKHYRVAAKMKFRNGSLLHSLVGGTIYLIVDGKRRPIVSPDAFFLINAKVSEAVTVSKDEIELHELGDDLG